LLSTFLYYEQADLVKKAVTGSAERTQLFARVDLIVNLLTLAIQVFAFGEMIKRLGTVSLLAAMPIISVIGFAALAVAPLLTTLMVFGILRRTGEYAISKPTRETLFNVLPDEQKYKAKNVIDTVVHRGGDMSSGWVFKGLSALGLTMGQICWISVPIGLVWLGAAWFLGQRHTQLSQLRTGAAETGD
jgi:AAA family ATP:ADP antiporter